MATPREAAIDIWSAGVAAVDSSRLIANAVVHRAGGLVIAGESYDLAGIDRIVVVGGGKAGAGMARGLEQALGSELVEQCVEGWLNVPADCVMPLQKIHLHAGRPAGVNEPTAEGVFGTREILNWVASLGPRDLCLVLLSGGGSALLPAPVDGLALEEKQRITRQLMHSGASIEELNAVRSCLSKIKSGGLLRAMSGGRGVGLIISDVVGDPLSVIASGPTVNTQPDPKLALEILERRCGQAEISHRVLEILDGMQISDGRVLATSPIPFRNVIVGNNRTAVSAAAQRAGELGYKVVLEESDRRGIAREVGRELAELCLTQVSDQSAARGRCWISGGEPTVELVRTNLPRQGGRNQELVLSAANRLWNHDLAGLALLAGGTDGEDGPTDAAGAVFDESVRREAQSRGWIPDPFLAINNSYPFFSGTGGLLRTGPTHTNVMDLRVAIVEPSRFGLEETSSVEM